MHFKEGVSAIMQFLPYLIFLSCKAMPLNSVVHYSVQMGQKCRINWYQISSYSLYLCTLSDQQYPPILLEQMVTV